MLLLAANLGSAQLLPIPLDQNSGNNNPRSQANPRVQRPPTAISEQQAVQLARQQFPGNVLRITLVGEPPERRYQIRMENEGKIFTVFVHATTGQVSEN